MACVTGGMVNGGAGHASRPMDVLCRRYRQQKPPRISVKSARRPSVKPTTSGPVRISLVEATGCVEVGNMARLVEDASPSRRTLHNQSKEIKKGRVRYCILSFDFTGH